MGNKRVPEGIRCFMEGVHGKMAKNLVIVESPAKAKTIKKFLGNNYEVIASNGHVRDLPKSQMGIDTDHDFEPKYITIRGKGDILAKLRKEVKKADRVYLATDPDREGEAIAWHLKNVLNIKDDEKCRIEFNEITKNAVKKAVEKPREINQALVDAQQARRILDRIVGYKLSPLLWKKVKKGTSAGRVQSVALKIIVDTDKKISENKPKLKTASSKAYPFFFIMNHSLCIIFHRRSNRNTNFSQTHHIQLY